MAKIAIEDIAAIVRKQGSMFLPGVAGRPGAFLADIARTPGSLGGVRVVSGFVSGINAFDALDATGAEISGFFPAPPHSVSPVTFLRETYFGIDRQVQRLSPAAVVIDVAPPRADGSSALGVAADFTETALRHAEMRIAVINPALPDLPLSPRVDLAGFDFVSEANHPLLVMPDLSCDSVSEEIAARLAALVPDGATIQLGIGRIPGQMLQALLGHRGLRFHSGIVTGGIRRLAESGALAEGVSVVAASFGGDPGFYSWLGGRREFRLAPVSYTHAPETLARIAGLVAINSALEVDLLGQVNAEWVGGRRVSAPGGLPDFAHAAQRAPRGLAVIALPSTDSTGQKSRIVTRLRAPATVPPGGVDVVVTEFGAADLRGRTCRERALLLASIAAPAFREELAASATSAIPA
ncbi:MAG: acetyl-CoA hydrolase/transferase C-terminal domain-containing protein [Beijerinckiaceae bacterium]|nr:acetyl-CoA hydrolase/transferase C-terminal domain-containing protein [Beijerinckiaceae bacterium]